MTTLLNFLTAVVAFFKTLFGGGKAKDPVQEIYRHDETVAEKQAAIVADHTRPATDDRLLKGDF